MKKILSPIIPKEGDWNKTDWDITSDGKWHKIDIVCKKGVLKRFVDGVLDFEIKKIVSS